MFSRQDVALVSWECRSLSVENLQQFDLCLAWNWEYDRDFVHLLESICHKYRLSFLQVTPHNLEQVLFELDNNLLTYRILIDRAIDTDRRFLTLGEWASHRPVIYLNPFHLARQAWNKVEMDWKLRQAGLYTPASFTLPPFDWQPQLPQLDLSCIGEKYVLKPAHGGGSKGVHIGSLTSGQVAAARQEYPADHYLLQAYISPVELNGRPAWFRIIVFGNQVFPCWWNPATHIYMPVQTIEEDLLSLHHLRMVAAVIRQLCGLDLFSTEVALTSQGLFVVVDPVNDPIDLRLQSRTPDGLPDEIAWFIANGLAEYGMCL